MFCCTQKATVTDNQGTTADGTIDTPFSPTAVADTSIIPSAQTTAVRVVVRVRPFINRESSSKSTNIIEIVDAQNLKVIDDPSGKNKAQSSERTFKYNAVLSQTSTQLEAYQSTAQGILLQVLQGYNGCIFAYGQTGSGKTYSMEGDFSTAGFENTKTSTITAGSGIIPRMCNELFQKLDDMTNGKGTGTNSTSNNNTNNGKKRTSTVTPLDTNSNDKWIWSLSAQYVEIYMEKITDLLSPKTSGKDNDAGGPIIRQKPSGEIFLEGVTSRPLHNESDIYTLLNEGQGRRTKGETNMNAASSRSHAVLSLSLTLSIVVNNNNGTATPATPSPNKEDTVVSDLSLTRTSGTR